MSTEQKLEIKKNGEYKNIYFKDKPAEGITGLAAGSHTFITKTPFAEGIEKEGKYGSFYVCKAEYEGEEVGFLLNAKEHEKYASAGGVDDVVKVEMTEKAITNFKTKVKMLVPTLEFTLVE